MNKSNNEHKLVLIGDVEKIAAYLENLDDEGLKIEKISPKHIYQSELEVDGVTRKGMIFLYQQVHQESENSMEPPAPSHQLIKDNIQQLNNEYTCNCRAGDKQYALFCLKEFPEKIDKDMGELLDKFLGEKYQVMSITNWEKNLANQIKTNMKEN